MQSLDFIFVIMEKSVDQTAERLQIYNESCVLKGT